MPLRFGARGAHAAAAWLLLVAMPAAAVDFAGSNFGPIPDNTPAGRDVTFNVTGLEGAASNVSISLTLDHTFVGDVRATLISPGGARLILFSNLGQRRGSNSGTSANFNGTYVFSDAANGDLWASIAGADTSFVAPPGAYRTSTEGEPFSNAGGCTTHLNRAFGPPTNASLNGTWTLRLVDDASADTGSVTAATLSITASDVLLRSSFEAGETPPQGSPTPSALRGNCRETLFDYTGTGLSSFVTVRNTGGGSGGEVTWTIRSNDNTITGPVSSFVLGVSTDFFLDGDFDGDGIRDPTVYTSATGLFTVRRSTRPTDVPLTIALGQNGDDPKQIGDYDGDNISDAAVYRAGAMAGQASSTIIRLSSTGALRTLTTGQQGQFPSGGLDYTGDGVADMEMQGNSGGIGRFTVYDGITGASFPSFDLGTSTDTIVTGSHAGDERGDTTVVRGVGGMYNWTTRERFSGTVTGPVVFGMSATDFILAGDYDGDGLDDYGYWRPSAMPGVSAFAIRRSTNGTTLAVPQGQQGDYPVANGRTH